MKRTLLSAAAILALAMPAFAQTTIIEKETTIKKVVPESGTTVSRVVVAPDPPPPPRVEAPPPSPGPRVVWTPGHWSWAPETHAYNWVSGKYLEPPREHASWVPGRWEHRTDGWVWEDGRWD